MTAADQAVTDASAGAVVMDEPEPGIARITLNRPARLNAMNRELIGALHQALDDIAERTDVRVVILTGAGRGFCAGLDLTDMGAEGFEVGNASGSTPASSESGTERRPMGRVQAGMKFQEHIASLIPKMRRLPVPIIAAVNGAATGGGLALVLGSDIRIAAASARFNVAFVRIGLSGCDIGVSWLLPRIVGAGRAQELMLTGRLIDAGEAERIGMVVRVVDDGALMDAALESARLVATNSPFGVRMTKEVMWSNLEVSSMRAAIDLENRTQILTSFTSDMSEAVGAFLEKRPPEFENR